MTPAPAPQLSPLALQMALGFIAGILAVLSFHQFGIGVMHALHWPVAPPYRMAPVPPFGMPDIIALALWGGVWGVVLNLAELRLAKIPGGYWLGATLFGMIVPTLVLWCIVLPVRHLPVAFGFRWPEVLVAPIANTMWGFGTALILTLLPGHAPRKH
ncbi:MAG TPA: hypothetical protein VM755_04375 [Stellaceae bacterium]|nr:hypothetical protein [Stellaceae bacterium]